MIAYTILLGLMPSILMVCLGGLVRRRLTPEAWSGLDRLNFEILFPTLIFVSASQRPIAMADLWTIGPAVWAIMVVGLALGWLLRPFGPEKFLDFAGTWQMGWRFNTAIAFVAVPTLAGDRAGEMAVAVGMAIPLANVFAVSALSRGGDLGVSGTVKRVALNPFFLASSLGVLVGVTGLEIPPVLLAPLKMIAAAAIPVALMSLGATMDWGALARLDRFSGGMAFVRLVALPLLTLVAVLLAGVSPAVAQVLVLFAALPSASAAHVLAAGFGANRTLAATLVAQITLLSAATLPTWIYIIRVVL